MFSQNEPGPGRCVSRPDMTGPGAGVRSRGWDPIEWLFENMRSLFRALPSCSTCRRCEGRAQRLHGPSEGRVFFEILYCQRVLNLRSVNQTEVLISHWIVWLELKGSRKVLDASVVLSGSAVHHAEVHVDRCDSGFQRNRFLQEFDSSVVLPASLQAMARFTNVCMWPGPNELAFSRWWIAFAFCPASR